MKLIKHLIFPILFLGFSINSLATSHLMLQTSKHKANREKPESVRSICRHQTLLHVFNASSQLILVKLPGTAIYDQIYPMEVEDIFSSKPYDAVEILLQDEDGILFFDSHVPNHATVEVSDVLMARRESPELGRVQAAILKTDNGTK
jgi:hypothetical protein